MDGSAFEYLTRAFGAPESRRRLLRLLGVLPIAGAVMPASEAETAARRRKTRRHQTQHPRHHDRSQQRQDRRGDAHSDACIPTGQRCPARKPRGKGKLSCNACCQGSFTINAAGKKVCGCQPNGGSCTTDKASSCCSGSCDAATNTCQIPPSAPCPRTCDGCCDGSGTCQAGTSNAVCGSHGESCVACSGTTPACEHQSCVACTSTTQCPVDTICDPSGACLPCDITCPATTCTGNPLQAFIDTHPAQTVFRICPGNYVGNLILRRSMTLIGAGDKAAVTTTLQGTGSTSAVIIPSNTSNPDVTLRNLRITGGGGNISGGGIRNRGHSLTVTDCTVSGNSTIGSGGGVFNVLESMSMTRCTISDNHATGDFASGGGIANFAQMTLTNCLVSGNTASGSDDSEGGGLYTNFGASNLTLVTTIVSGNSAATGGGIYIAAGTVTLRNGSHVNGANTATFFGGGIYNNDITTLDASSVSDNTAGFDGGGIYNFVDATVTLQNGSTVSGNTALNNPNCGGDGGYSGTGCA